MRKDSHNRRNQRETDECVSNQLSNVRNLGLYNNPSFWGFEFHQQYRWHRKIVVFQAFEQKRILESPVTWLRENGHEVTIVVGDMGRDVRKTKYDEGFSSIIVYDLALFHILPSSQDYHEFEPRGSMTEAARCSASSFLAWKRRTVPYLGIFWLWFYQVRRNTAMGGRFLWCEIRYSIGFVYCILNRLVSNLS